MLPPVDDRLNALPRAVHILACWPRHEATQRLPDRVAAPFSHLSPLTAPSQSRPPLPTEHRRCHSSSPLQKRAGHLARSLAVIPSATSTSQPGRLCLGKDEFVVSFPRRRGCSRRRWRPAWPALLAPLPSLLCLTLGLRSTEEARRVTVRGHDAVVSSEPVKPRPSAAVAIATPSSCVISCNRWFPYVHLGEANTLAPLPSPEEPPAACCAVAVLRSPTYLAVTRDPAVSRRG